MIGEVQQALVLGSSDHVEPNHSEPVQLAQPGHSAIQPDFSQEAVKTKSACMANGPQQSRNKVSLKQWHHEMKVLREDQPDQSMRKSGSFLQSGASVIWWTSGHPL